MKCIKIEKKCNKCKDINNIIQNGGTGDKNIIDELLNKYITKYNNYKSLLIS